MKLKVDLQKKKQNLMEKQIAQQKVLLDKLSKNKNTLKPEEKEKIKSTIKALHTTIERLKDELLISAKSKINAIPPPTTNIKEVTLKNFSVNSSQYWNSFKVHSKILISFNAFFNVNLK